MKHTLRIVKTSNPAIIKLESSDFLVKGSYEYQNIDQAKASPLAQQLFHLPFIKTVYIASNFVALERYQIVEWSEVEQEVRESVEAYLNSGAEAVIEGDEEKGVPISIYAESTPNPSVMKFVANRKLVTSVCEYKNIDEARHSPLATALFHFPFVREVFIDDNYVSVTKYDIASWQDITMELREFIQQHLRENKAVEQTPQHHEQVVQDTQIPLDEQGQRIADLLEEYVKPAVASDGGNIRLVSYDTETHRVRVMLQGACSGCPSSTMTLKNGIETMLREMLADPQISVEAVNG